MLHYFVRQHRGTKTENGADEFKSKKLGMPVKFYNDCALRENPNSSTGQ
jgi:hypothetical protein